MIQRLREELKKKKSVTGPLRQYGKAWEELTRNGRVRRKRTYAEAFSSIAEDMSTDIEEIKVLKVNCIFHM